MPLKTELITEATEKDMVKREKKLVANNKKARHDYFIEEVYEAGIVLTGTGAELMASEEVKKAYLGG